MVTETKESMTQMYDTVADTTRATMEAGRRVQESWFDAVGGTGREPGAFEDVYAQSEKFTREWFPFVGKNMHTFAESVNTCFQATMDATRAASDVTMRSGDSDWYQKSRDLWDASFNAFRVSVNAVNKATKRTMENWASLCQAAGTHGSEPEGRNRPDSGKMPPKGAK